MRLLVCGGRDFDDAEYAIPRLQRLHLKTPVDRLICGMARGGDTLAYEWAKQVNIPVDEYRPDWKALGKAAGPIRNQEMLDEGRPEMVVGLPGGNGTAHMLSIARAAGVPVIEYRRHLFSRARDEAWGWASNFWSHEQHDQDGVAYKTNEHWYQAEKTLDPETRRWIAESPDATIAKKRGNHHSVALRSDWDTHKLHAMMEGLRAKFIVHSDISQKLLNTGDLYLVEFAPWGDWFWGIDKEHVGLNWLGRLLMRRRDELVEYHG